MIRIPIMIRTPMSGGDAVGLTVRRRHLGRRTDDIQLFIGFPKALGLDACGFHTLVVVAFQLLKHIFTSAVPLTSSCNAEFSSS